MSCPASSPTPIGPGSRPSHSTAKSSRLIHSSGYFTLQNIAEFWNVATRPLINNGLGFSAAVTLAEVGKIEQALMLLPDSAAIYQEWKRLVVTHNVLGSKVHDQQF